MSCTLLVPTIYSTPCVWVQSATVKVVQHSVEFEEALATLVMMTAPMAPHLASELWAGVYYKLFTNDKRPTHGHKHCIHFKISIRKRCGDDVSK